MVALAREWAAEGQTQTEIRKRLAKMGVKVSGPTLSQSLSRAAESEAQPKEVKAAAPVDLALEGLLEGLDISDGQQLMTLVQSIVVNLVRQHSRATSPRERLSTAKAALDMIGRVPRIRAALKGSGDAVSALRDLLVHTDEEDARVLEKDPAQWIRRRGPEVRELVEAARSALARAPHADPTLATLLGVAVTSPGGVA